MKTGLIYIIKNHINNKVYIGQTTNDLQTRFNQHCKNSVLKTRYYKLYNAIKKYGKKQFYIELLESDIPIDKLNEKEIEYIELYNSFNNGYNSTKGGDGRIINKLYDEDVIIKEYQKGKSCSEIGKRFNVSGATISRVLKRKGIAARHDENKYESFGETFVEMWNSGIKIDKIADYFKVDPKTIRRASKHYNLLPRYKRRDYGRTKKVFNR